MPKVAILSLGGTIAMGAKSGIGGGIAPSLTATDLISAVPDLDRAAGNEAHQVCNVPSVELTLTDMVQVRDKILKLQGRGFDGVAIAQGTDMTEETSWILDLPGAHWHGRYRRHAQSDATRRGRTRQPAGRGSGRSVGHGPGGGRRCRLQRSGPRGPVCPENPHQQCRCVHLAQLRSHWLVGRRGTGDAIPYGANGDHGPSGSAQDALCRNHQAWTGGRRRIDRRRPDGGSVRHRPGGDRRRQAAALRPPPRRMPPNARPGKSQSS